VKVGGARLRSHSKTRAARGPGARRRGRSCSDEERDHPDRRRGQAIAAGAGPAQEEQLEARVAFTALSRRLRHASGGGSIKNRLRFAAGAWQGGVAPIPTAGGPGRAWMARLAEWGRPGAIPWPTGWSWEKNHPDGAGPVDFTESRPLDRRWVVAPTSVVRQTGAERGGRALPRSWALRPVPRPQARIRRLPKPGVPGESGADQLPPWRRWNSEALGAGACAFGSDGCWTKAQAIKKRPPRTRQGAGARGRRVAAWV